MYFLISGSGIVEDIILCEAVVFKEKDLAIVSFSINMSREKTSNLVQPPKR